MGYTDTHMNTRDLRVKDSWDLRNKAGRQGLTQGECWKAYVKTLLCPDSNTEKKKSLGLELRVLTLSLVFARSFFQKSLANTEELQNKL